VCVFIFIAWKVVTAREMYVCLAFVVQKNVNCICFFLTVSHLHVLVPMCLCLCLCVSVTQGSKKMNEQTALQCCSLDLDS
jgi:heme/copper-type cytochrome/quinol oxidase subunit 3